MKKNGTKNVGLLQHILQQLGRGAGAGYAPMGAAPKPARCARTTLERSVHMSVLST